MTEKGIYTHQAKATEKFGVTFRSKLEAEWAHWFSQFEQCSWDYIDSPWHDFVVDGVCVEVKPIGEKFLASAVGRIPVSQRAMVLMGSPSSSDCAVVQVFEGSLDMRPMNLTELTWNFDGLSRLYVLDSRIGQLLDTEFDECNAFYCCQQILLSNVHLHERWVKWVGREPVAQELKSRMLSLLADSMCVGEDFDAIRSEILLELVGK